MLSAAPASVCKNDEGPKEAFNFVPSSNQANKCFGLLSDCVWEALLRVLEVLEHVNKH